MNFEGNAAVTPPDRASDNAVSVELLRHVHAREVETAPTEHSDRSPDCLSLSALDEASNRLFAGSQGAHVSACSFCQKLLAMAWRLECPGTGLVLMHLGRASPISMAMVEHVERDGCRRCLRLTNSRLLRTVATRLQTTSGDGSTREVDRYRAAAGFGLLPAMAGVFAPSPWAATPEEPRGTARAESDGGEPPWPFRLRLTAPGGMAATLRQTDRDTLVVHLQSRGPSDAGRTVDVEVASEGESLEASVVLHGSGRRCEGRHAFGRMAELRPLLGGSCALVVAFRDEPSSGFPG